MRVGVVGVGRMGRRHIQAARVLGCEVVGVSDPNADSRALAGEEAGMLASALFEHAEEMLDAMRPECVVIATTADSHADITCLAAASGARFILCEKPMATSLADCDRMIDSCRRYGARLAVNHQMRYMEQYTRTKSIVASPEFGGLSSVTVVAGNFGLAMNGTHYFEMFRYLAEENPAEVTAWFSPEHVANPRGAQFEDRAGEVRVTTATGKRLFLEADSDQGHGLKVVYAGPYGQLVVDELAGVMNLCTRQPEHRALPTTRYGMPWTDDTIRIEPADVIAPTRAVLEALLARDDYPSGEDGRAAVATLVAAYLSDETGHRPVAVDEALPVHREFPWA